MKFDIGVVGRTVWDEWDCDQASLRDGFADNFGGSGANTAVNLACLGLNVSFFSLIGNDERSKIYLTKLSNLLDVSYLTVSSGELPRALLTPEKKFKWLTENRGLLEEVSYEKINDFAKACSSLFFVEPNFLIPESIVNANLSFWSPQSILFSNPELITKMMPYNWRVIFLNQKECVQLETIFKCSIDRLSLKFSKTTFIVTKESFPVELYREGFKEEYPTIPSEHKFSTGCGDAFASGYIFGLLKGFEEINCIKIGNILANKVLSQIGCQLLRADCQTILERITQITIVTLGNHDGQNRMIERGLRMKTRRKDRKWISGKDYYHLFQSKRKLKLLLINSIVEGDAYCSIPSHDGSVGPAQTLAKFLSGFYRKPIKELLFRTKANPSAHDSMIRPSIEDHLNTISFNIKSINHLEGSFILVDNVVATGNSLTAGLKILLKHGVKINTIFTLTIDFNVFNYLNFQKQFSGILFKLIQINRSDK